MGGSAGTGGSGGVCSVDDPATCPTADSMSFCSNGQLTTVTCNDFCSSIGFPTGPCAEPDGCDCDLENPTDMECFDAMNVLCNCLEGSTKPCTDTYDPNDPNSLAYYPPYIYVTCHSGSAEDMTFLHCLLDQANMDPAPLCSDAFTACTPAQ
jgi:hypothetical protein